jgi:hypothetical protein
VRQGQTAPETVPRTWPKWQVFSFTLFSAAYCLTFSLLYRAHSFPWYSMAVTDVAFCMFSAATLVVFLTRRSF